jgi:hypothetical protein
MALLIQEQSFINRSAAPPAARQGYPIDTVETGISASRCEINLQLAPVGSCLQRRPAI